MSTSQIMIIYLLNVGRENIKFWKFQFNILMKEPALNEKMPIWEKLYIYIYIYIYNIYEIIYIYIYIYTYIYIIVSSKSNNKPIAPE